VRQRAHLHDDAAALGGGHARLQRLEAAGDFVRDVELRCAQRVGVARRVQRDVGAHRFRLGQWPIEDVADGNPRRAGEACREHRQAADGAGAGDEHRLAEEIAAAVYRVQRDSEGLGERDLAERDVARHRVALALAHHEVLAEHALHVREAARAAEEAHVLAQLLAPLAAIAAPPARVRRTDRDLVAFLDPCDG